MRHLPAALHLAAERLVRAASERQSADDQLIDAVVAWEALLGTRRYTKAKMTLAMEHLLHPEDPDGRQDRIAAWKRIYELRSKVAHGHPPASGTLSPSAQEALRVGLDALVALLARPDIVVLPTSHARAIKLIEAGFPAPS